MMQSGFTLQHHHDCILPQGAAYRSENGCIELDPLFKDTRPAAFKLAGLCDTSTLQALPGFGGPVCYLHNHALLLFTMCAWFNIVFMRAVCVILSTSSTFIICANCKEISMFLRNPYRTCRTRFICMYSVCVCVFVFVSVFVRVYVCLFVILWVCASACVCVCVFVCCIYMCTYACVCV